MRTKTRLVQSFITACLLLGAAAPSGAASSIGGNFIGRGADPGSSMLPADSAGVVPQANWNNIDSGGTFDGTTVSLNDSADNFTSVKIIYDANDSWNSDGGTGTPDEKLMKGCIKANPDPDTAPANNTDRMLFTISGLAPGATYDVIVYTANNGAGAEMNLTVGATTYYIAVQNNFTASGATFLPATSIIPGTYAEANYAQFPAVAPSAGGTIIIEARKNIVDPQINDGIGIAAVQVVQVSGPAFPPNADTCSITSNPQDTFAIAGGTATFTVGTQGPRKIQWTKDNVPIPGATGATLTYTAALGDNNALIRAIVYNNVNTNTSAPATLFVDAASADVLTQGFATVERWEGIGGNTGTLGIDDLKTAIGAGAATRKFYVGGLNVPDAGIDNFGARVTAWVKPDVTGNYHFFIRSDDSSQLYINDVNPGSGPNAMPDPNFVTAIAQEDGCCNAFGEPGSSTRTTATPIALEAGKLYAILVYYKEGGGGDFLQVAWRLESDTTPAASLSPIPGANLWTMATGAGSRSTLTDQPDPVVLIEPRKATFTVGVTTVPTAGTFSVQWLSNGVPIPGAGSGATYTTPATTVADDGKLFQARIFTLQGIVMSATAQLTVIPDTFPPVPGAGALATSAGAIEIGVGFDEAVNPADLVAANFELTGGASGTFTVATNSYGDYAGVLFVSTTGLVPGGTYGVLVKNVRDLKGNAISSGGVNAAVTVGKNTGWANTGTQKRPGQVVPVGADGFDILNGGRTEWSSYDEATIAFIKKTNDFDVKVQIIYAEPASQWARVGLMARNDLNVGEDPNDRTLENNGSTASAYAQTHINPNQTMWSANRYDAGAGLTPANPNPNNGHEQNQRLTRGGGTSGWGSTATSPVYPDEWLRLQRVGTTIRGFRGKDGINWIDQGTTTLTDQQAHMFVGPFAAVELGNIWNAVDHDIWGAFNPAFDRLFVYQFRNFGNTFPPTLSISVAGGTATITYTGTLYSAPSVTGPWSEVVGATSPYPTGTSGADKYFRARGDFP